MPAVTRYVKEVLIELGKSGIKIVRARTCSPHTLAPLPLTLTHSPSLPLTLTDKQLFAITTVTTWSWCGGVEGRGNRKLEQTINTRGTCSVAVRVRA